MGGADLVDDVTDRLFQAQPSDLRLGAQLLPLEVRGQEGLAVWERGMRIQKCGCVRGEGV